jgi:hypothetical protein
MEEEIWVDVLGYEGIYKVSNKGRVMGLKRVIKAKTQTGIRKWTIPSVIFKDFKHPSGYIRIPLRKDKKAKHFYVHNIVMNSFYRPKPKGMDVDHIDKNRTNNNLNNLRYLSYKENRGILGNTHASPNYKKAI